jgi:hypothetical protein
LAEQDGLDAWVEIVQPIGRLGMGHVARRRDRAGRHVLRQAGVDQRQAQLDVRDDLHLADGPHARRHLDRHDPAPGRVDEEAPRLARDGPRKHERIVATRKAPDVSHCHLLTRHAAYSATTGLQKRS